MHPPLISVQRIAVSVFWTAAIAPSRSDTIEFMTIESPTGNDLVDAWGAAPDDIWAVGSSGTMVHFDGATWQSLSIGGETTDLRSIWGTSTDNIYATARDSFDQGLLYHYNGSAWNLVANHGSSDSLVECSPRTTPYTSAVPRFSATREYTPDHQMPRDT